MAKILIKHIITPIICTLVITVFNYYLVSFIYSACRVNIVVIHTQCAIVRNFAHFDKLHHRLWLQIIFSVFLEHIFVFLPIFFSSFSSNNNGKRKLFLNICFLQDRAILKITFILNLWYNLYMFYTYRYIIVCT